MAIPTILPCDGCGQLASAEHLSRRLQRLEWATRFRPIHIQALLLTAAGPDSDTEFLYNPATNFDGPTVQILAALGLDREGKSFEEIVTEIQRRGLVLASSLECPVEPSSDAALLHDLLERHLPSALARIRRSLKPKRVLVLSPELQSFLPQLTESSLGCPVFYTPLHFSSPVQAQQTAALADFRSALPSLAAHGS
ncbi:MAG TPA: hypothetical protein VLX60_11160 [Terriglobales bacterium]|nr:hypothetical protein [Terriglobales bacterium]